MQNKKTLLERLSQDVVLGAEGYIYELERRGYIKAGPYVPEVVLDHPTAVTQLHREYMRAGAEVMVALTYYAYRDKMKDVSREGELETLNRQAVRLAKKVAKEGQALVAGNISNTWSYDAESKQQSSEHVRRMYAEQVGWAADEGVDLVIAETLEYMGEALIALEVIKSFDLPAIVTLAPSGAKSRDGYDWAEICRELDDQGADVVGLNCIQGPASVMPTLKKIRKTVRGYVAAQPVPYRTTPQYPHFQYIKSDESGEVVPPFELEPYLMTRSEMADFAVIAKRIGINYIGICSGSSPHHVRAMAEALGRTVPASRYSPDMKRHAQLGSEDFVKNYHGGFLEDKL